MWSQFSDLIAATAAFVFGHLILSSGPLRGQLVERLGEARFRGLYSLFVLAAFAWMLLAWRAAPYVELWRPPDWARWIPIVLMLPACLLLVGGVTQRSPTLVGGETAARDGVLAPAAGFQSISRHCFLNATALWALSHLAVRGDAASAVMMGGILVLSVAGMWHIDQRRARSQGAAWGPIMLTTSQLPFLAALQGRCRLDWRGLGWWRPLLGLLLYALLIGAHPHLIGVAVLRG